MRKNVGLPLLIGVSLLGIVLSFVVYDGGGASTLYFGVMPGLPFICISVFAGALSNNATKGAVIGATAGALMVSVLCYGVLYYEAITYSGGGANIGLGLLLLPLPIYYVLFIWLGWALGGRSNHSR
ncbi:hypothetical protein CWE13_02825 [Aliidiomarina shirensis]|uniref:Uncharacterized protein n=1 Tax=Aliidiomarina shirensis TaxID=1048642 RepID=A0A432WXW8_9GAMM|nr:hypothetical protein [Aliidiomarina shirensis]RUO38596.1 hypothetical protein CWE13_02825 [Aliidiomarina shirensis]